MLSGEEFVAERISGIGSSGIRKVFDLAATMEDPIDLSMGQPDFKVPDTVKQAAIEAIRADRNGYTVTHGLPGLREGIAGMLKSRYQWEADVIVTCGVSGGVVLAMMACLNSGDEVLLADPYFVSYKHLVHLAGGRAVTVNIHEDFKLDRDAFAAAITPKTKLMLLNSPANPTGVVHSADEIKGLCELAREHNLLIISDEIYETLSYDGRPTSPIAFAPERTVLLGGFGKSHAVTGWRLGFAAGPPAVIREMAKVQQFTFVCAPHMAQIGAIEALKTDMSAQVKEYRRKRDVVIKELEGAFEFPKPCGGFFVYCRAPKGYATGSEFVYEAIKHKVLTVPGSAFSEQDTHFRVSYAVPDDRLRRGCEVLRNLAR